MRAPKLSENAYMIIKEQLLSMEPGSFLSIRQIAMKNEMSHTPVRTAFARLEKEGYIKKIPGVGYFVVSADYSDFQKIYDVRECVENYAMDKVLGSLTADDFNELRRINDEIKKAFSEERWKDVIEQDLAFHIYIIKKLDNHYLEDLYTEVRSRYNSSYASGLTATEKNYVDDYPHDKLIETMETGDVEASIELNSQQLKDSFARMASRVFIKEVPKQQ